MGRWFLFDKIMTYKSQGQYKMNIKNIFIINVKNHIFMICQVNN